MLFLRDGSPHEGRHYDDEKGKPVCTRQRVCRRCGGLGGGEQWRHTGWTCYECGGTGKGRVETLKLYTREQLDKLNASLEKRNAKKLAAAQVEVVKRAQEAEARRDTFEAVYGALFASAEAYFERSDFLRDVVERARQRCEITENQAGAIHNTVAKMAASDAARAASVYVGNVGDRITADVVVERVAYFDRRSFSGFGSETVYIVSMRDSAGNALVSKSPRFYAEKGDRLTIAATVKDHSDYRGEAQTTIQRIVVKSKTKAAA